MSVQSTTAFIQDLESRIEYFRCLEVVKSSVLIEMRADPEPDESDPS